MVNGISGGSPLHSSRKADSAHHAEHVEGMVSAFASEINGLTRDRKKVLKQTTDALLKKPIHGELVDADESTRETTSKFLDDLPDQLDRYFS